MPDVTELSRELDGVDALCERWARESRETSPLSVNILHRWRVQGDGASSRGVSQESMSEDAAALDRILASSPKMYLLIVREWYLYSTPVETKARNIGTSRTALYAWWARTLEYLRGRLHAEGIVV